jgi:hypothetical protein
MALPHRWVEPFTKSRPAWSIISPHSVVPQSETTFSVAHAFKECVRTASGSDRITKNRDVHLGPIRCNPFPRGFVADARKLPDPVATARGSDTPY